MVNPSCSQRQNLKAKAVNAKALKATTKAKAWTSEVKAFKRMVGAEIKIHSTYDSLTG